MAVWFARRASQAVNANDGSTWNDKADGTGNWLTWASLASGDILCANGNSALSLVSLNIGSGRLSTAAEVGSSDTGTTGGGYTVIGTTTLVANLQAGSTNCLVATGSSWTLTFTGNAVGGTTADKWALYINSATITVNMTGNATGGTASTAYGIYNKGTTFTLNGNCTQGSTSTSFAVMNGPFTGTMVINGNINPNAVNQQSANPMTVTGNMINSSAGLAIASAGGSQVIYNPGAGNYITYPKSTGGAGTYNYVKSPAATDVRSGTVAGDITGSLVLPTAAQVEYGVTFDASTVGAYTGPTAADVATATWAYADRRTTA